MIKFGWLCERSKLKVNVEKSKVSMVGNKKVVYQVKIYMNGDIMEISRSLKYLGSYFSEHRGLQADVKMRVAKLSKAFCTVSKMCKFSGSSLLQRVSCVEESCAQSDAWGGNLGRVGRERYQLGVVEMRCPRPM